jgi:hypothetical protein
MTSPSSNPTSADHQVISAGRDRPRCAGRCRRPRKSRGTHAAPTARTTYRPPSGSAVTARASRSRGSCSSAATTRSASSARRRSSPPENSLLPVRVRSSLTQMRCGRLPRTRCRHAHVDGPERTSGRNTLPPARSPHQTSRRRPGSQPRVADRSKPGRPRAHPTPKPDDPPHDEPDATPLLTPNGWTSKRVHGGGPQRRPCVSRPPEAQHLPAGLGAGPIGRRRLPAVRVKQGYLCVVADARYRTKPAACCAASHAVLGQTAAIPAIRRSRWGWRGCT